MTLSQFRLPSSTFPSLLCSKGPLLPPTYPSLFAPRQDRSGRLESLPDTRFVGRGRREGDSRLRPQNEGKLGNRVRLKEGRHRQSQEKTLSPRDHHPQRGSTLKKSRTSGSVDGVRPRLGPFVGGVSVSTPVPSSTAPTPYPPRQPPTSGDPVCPTPESQWSRSRRVHTKFKRKFRRAPAERE